MRLIRFLLFAATLLPAALFAAIEVYEFESVQEQQRFEELTSALRCPKCQNQNIAASNAPIANDMREQVFQRIQAGESDQEIVGAMVERFGEFVNYRPPLNRATLLLWFGPLLLAFIGLIVVLVIIRRSRRGAGPVLSAEERARVDALLSSKPRGSSPGKPRS